MKTNHISTKFYRGPVTALLIILGIVAISATAAIRLTSDDAEILSFTSGKVLEDYPDTTTVKSAGKTVTKTISSPDGKDKTVEVKVITSDDPSSPGKPGTMIIKVVSGDEDSTIIVKADTIIIEGDKDMSASYQEALKEFRAAQEELQMRQQELLKLQHEKQLQELEGLQKHYQFDIQTEIMDDSTGTKAKIYKIDKNIVVVPDEDLYSKYYSPGTYNYHYTIPDFEPFNEDILKDYQDRMEDFNWQELEIDKYFDLQGEPLPEITPIPEWTPIPPSDPQLFYFYHKSEAPSLEKLMKQELLKDRLIIPGQRYIIELDNKEMIINGEEQSKEFHKKYKRLYESAEEAPLGPEMKYRLVL